MNAETHSTVREGLLVGLLGGGAVALWWLIVDLFSGAPLATPNALGRVLLGGDRPTGATPLDLAAIGAYTGVHFGTFAVLGLVLVRLVHLVQQHWELRMGLWIAIVLTTAWLTLHTYVLARYTRHAIPLWAMVAAAVVGIATMLAVAWSRHPELGRSLRQVPLADEVESPPAPPPGAPPRT
ncbi:MAG: hypothetical protein ACREOF_13200 [Gemmatimonadales bacterium]